MSVTVLCTATYFASCDKCDGCVLLLQKLSCRADTGSRITHARTGAESITQLNVGVLHLDVVPLLR